MKLNCFAQVQIENNENCNLTYRLFPTEKMSNFIKLNTRTGQMWQLQFGDKEQNRKEVSLNSVSLIEKDKEVDNRPALYATQNIRTFILLDQIDGKTWQVLWSTNPKQMKIIPIEYSHDIVYFRNSYLNLYNATYTKSINKIQTNEKIIIPNIPFIDSFERNGSRKTQRHFYSSR